MIVLTHPSGVEWVITRWMQCVRGPGFCQFFGSNEWHPAMDCFSDWVSHTGGQVGNNGN